MAIAKMQKITVMTLPSHEKPLLEAVQNLQNVEVKTMNVSEESEEELQHLQAAQKRLNKSIERTEGQLADIRHAQQVLRSYVPAPSFIEKHRHPLPQYTFVELSDEISQIDADELVRTVEATRERHEAINSTLEDLSEKEAFLSQWMELSFIPKDTQQFDYIQTYVGTVPQSADNQFINLLEASDELIVVELFQRQEELGVALFTSKPVTEEVQTVLTESRFNELVYPYDQVPVKEMELVSKEINDLKAEREQIVTELNGMKEELRQLEVAEEYYYAYYQRLLASELAITTDHIYVLSGWLEADEREPTVQTIRTVIPESETVVLIDEIVEEEMDDVPIVLNNNKLVSPFESITKMYSLPRYDEIDPTGIVMVFYMVFFGMMMGDLGYGLLLWAGTLIPLKFLHLGESLKEGLNFVHILSYPTMIIGIIYGSFFGVTMPTQLISTTENAIEILMFSIALGFVHILVGLGLNTYIQWKNGDTLEGIKDGVSWMLILIGLLVGALGTLLFSNSLISNVGFGIALLGALLVLILSVYVSTNKVGGFALGLYDLYGITGYIGDLVSYSRLMALGLSGGSIAMAFNMLVSFFPPVLRFTFGILLIIGLHLFNLGLSFLSAYVHGIRLIFVEFFGKFYTGGGKEFKPLKGLGEHIEIRKQ